MSNLAFIGLGVVSFDGWSFGGSWAQSNSL